MFKSLLLLVVFSTAAQAQVRYVFKGENSSAKTFASNVKKMTFGLTETQTEMIFALTGGRINFGDVYYLDHNPRLMNTMKNEPGFAGVIFPDIPPPVRIQQIGDTYLINQWWIQKLRVKEAWSMATGKGVTIADCDAGYYHDEPDLFDNMLLEHRYDVSDSREPLIVNDGPFATHGTSVTAIIAGVLNGLGTNGIAFNSKIVPLQNFNYDSSDELDKEEATARCILNAVATPDVDIIVLENQTGDGSSETFVGTRDAVRLAQEAGMIVVSAAGNYGKHLVHEKADDTGSIIVGALYRNDTAASWSNYGERITVAAYGEGLYTLQGPGGAFAEFGGTSGATPLVAATVALMKEVNPMLTPEQARAILLETRVTNPATVRVGGLLSVPEAVNRARQTPVDFTASYKQWMFRQEIISALR